ncbi:hypothetical protein RCL1_001900 [Eukaryota sp. TZLM3-RCL]
MSRIVVFRISYHTQYGEDLCVRGSIPALGSNNRYDALRLHYEGAGIWTGSITLDDLSLKSFSYRYFVAKPISSIEEHGDDRTIFISPQASIIRCNDVWRSSPVHEEFFFDRAIFKRVICHRDDPKSISALPPVSPSAVTIRFSVKVPRIDPSHTVCIVGNITKLGNWDPAFGLSMEDGEFPIFKTDLTLSHQDLTSLEYKYVIIDKSGTSPIWEDGVNRKLTQDLVIVQQDLPSVCHHDDGFFRYLHSNFKGFGVICPIFSLKSSTSCGIGEFNDMKLAADWLSSMGAKMLQILPINDTRVHNDWKDSYPYSAISAFALHPIYIHLQALPGINEEMMAEIQDFINKSSDSKGFDYDARIQFDYTNTVHFKETIIRRCFDAISCNLAKDKTFNKWVRSQSKWLPWYAVFLYLRKLNDDFKWTTWPKEHQNLTLEDIETWTNPSADHYDEILYTYWVQYQLHLQLFEATQYCAKKGVAVKGDIPIGVDPNSVDVWQRTDEFKLTSLVGAPADAFSVLGQNWLFPSYDYPHMLSKENPLEWWTQRMVHMSTYFHAFRIDHVIGLFRLWEIRSDSDSALMGRYEPSIKFSIYDLKHRYGFWDFDRLTLPFVNDQILHENFGSDTYYIRDWFFEEFHGRLQFKQHLLQSEKGMKAHVRRHLEAEKVKRPEELEYLSDRFAEIEFKLMLLWNNRVFIKEEQHGEEFFYPVFNVSKNTSFMWLNHHERQKIEEIYHEYLYGDSQNRVWEQSVYSKLPKISQCHDMLVCGEDLGVLPKITAEVLDSLHILGLRIQRMPSDPAIEFGHPSDYSWLTVSSPSTHDMPSIRGWIEEDQDRALRFCRHVLGLDHVPSINEIVVRIFVQHLYGQSMWTVFLVQDLLSVSERLAWKGDSILEQVNVPSERWHYWRYRIHHSLEDLINDREFNVLVKKMLADSGRLSIY